MRRTLLLFDEDNPFWNAELVFMAQEDPKELEVLYSEGLLEATSLGNYRLSSEGKRVLLCYGREWGVPISLPSKDVQEADAIWSTRLRLLLDKSFVGRWSLKEYKHNVVLSYFPGLAREESWVLDEKGRLHWLYADSPMMQAFLKRYPETGIKVRGKEPPDAKEVIQWCKNRSMPEGKLHVPLLLWSRYDFTHYARFSPLPHDIWKLMNADRMFCFRIPDSTCENPAVFIDQVAAVRLFLTYYSRVHLPGYTHFDTEDQENLNWILWVGEDDSIVKATLNLLSPMAKELVDFEMPLHIKATSMESLMKIQEPYETIYDLVFYEFVNIASPDPS